MTSVNRGSGLVSVGDSAVDGDVAAVGPGAGAEVVSGAAVAVGPGAGAEGAAEAAGSAVAVEVGAGDGSASAGASDTVVSEAKVTTNAVMSAVVFRIEFTFCLSMRPPPH